MNQALAVGVGAAALPLLLGCALWTQEPQQTDFVAAPIIQLNDNGAWSWFMDERAIVHDGKIIVGSVRSVGDYDTTQSGPNWGNVEAAVFDVATGKTAKVVLHQHFEQDDHNSPAFLVLPNKSILAMYSKHGQQRKIYYRFSEPGNPLAWSAAHEFESPGTSRGPFKADNVTYNNLFRLQSGRIINFYRGVRLDPNYMYSDNDGQTWEYGGHLLLGKGGYSPYMRYAQDGDKIHFIATEDHPRNYANSVYHGFLQDGNLHFSDGKLLGPISKSATTNYSSWDLTRVFAGDPDNVCWIDDIKVDARGRPVIVFSVKKDGRGLGRGAGGLDIRYHYGRWDGKAWQTYPMAYAGTRLYAGEDDYTGLASLDRADHNVVYMSTDADPVTGTPLISTADQRRHHELFRGVTRDLGKSWQWQPITANSTMDNLRPLAVQLPDARAAVVWMRGSYRNNRGDWTTAVVASILPPVK